ncbi:hypothetical protein KFZ56_04470 [Virgibacillus sp. NKC19-3]|uniref:hypothetical protein n=1 Tax=Virgibacillus saliphilus TaxID=2831674 RepID=UPI001C9B8F5E|nr:hypothetical protein [Virgibacillus sp. NKC19-3]MBY7142360.1 hypothetical protein [Virgibacillus sp. NKC19-3]
MRNIFSGSFSQVEDAISESFAKNSIDTIERFSFGKSIIFIIFFMGGFSALYGVSIWMGGNLDTGTIVLDTNNEFVPFLSNIWYPILQSTLMVITLFGGLYYRKKNNVKGFIIYNTSFTVFVLLIMFLYFKFTQLIVYSFPLRMVYTVLFIFCLVYVFVRSYQNAKELVFGEKKKRSTIVEWFSRNKKSVLSVLAAVGSLYYLGKVIFPATGDLETRLMGGLIDFVPLSACLAILGFLYLNSVVIRSYYLNKYSEDFRIKFGVDKSEWYGKKHKDKDHTHLKNQEM